MAIIDKIQLSGTVYTIGNETTTAVTSASTDNEIPTAKAVYDAIPQGGGGKAVSGGTNISITTGETADTINCTLPITINSDKTTILPNNASNVGNGGYNFVGGKNCQITNYASGSYPDYAFCYGYNNTVTTEGEAAFGRYNQTKNASGAQYYSGTSIFTIGNGNWTSRRHNALEVMFNGDIYIADTNDTSTTNWYQKPMIKLQDALGGGGASYSAGTGIDITNDVISVTGMTAESAFTAHTADTTVHTTAAEKTSWNGAVTNASNAITALGGLSLVKLTQAEYDALTTKDSNVLYVIVG